MVKTPTMPWLREETSDRKTARLLERNRFTGLPIDWDAIVGHDHAKRELRVVAAALTRRDLAERLGVPLVKGIVITGPPGTGKTLLARAFASTVERPVFVLSAAELTAGRIRRVYELLADIPSVVVIDEIDIVARRAYGRANRSVTVGALCVALDGVKPVTGPITIGLTAEDIDDLDRSVVRSGRLTTEIRLEPPTRTERLALWQRYTADIPTAAPLDLETASDRSQGLTGADIAAIALAAAGLALADNVESLDQAHLDEALDRRGLVRRPPIDDERARRDVAIHEAGHAIYAFSVMGAAALKSAVVSRSGRGEGHVSIDGEWTESSGWQTREWREATALSLAGIVAEELVSPGAGPTFGSEQDIAKATDIALRAHAAGLVSSFGRISTERVERGHDPDSYDERGSEAMREGLWKSVRKEVAAAEVACRAVLKPQIEAIEQLATALDAAGTLSGRQLVEAVRSAGAREADTGTTTRTRRKAAR
jgi:cell division protease FtsH